MPNRLLVLAAAAAIVIGLLVFSPFLRRLVSATIRLVIFVGASFAAIAGTAILMNNETIFGSPGTAARVTRFLTVNYAATSRKGLGDAPCAVGKERTARKPSPHHRLESGAKHSRTQVQAPANPAAAAAAEADVYPELVTRGYPGIGRARLFRMAEDTVNGLGGWKIIRSDPRSGTLDCLYTTRVFRFEDDVKVVVTPTNEIELCSQSKVGEPGSDSWLRFFHGDFGANMGHIKQFYMALEPKVDAFYKARD